MSGGEVMPARGGHVLTDEDRRKNRTGVPNEGAAIINAVKNRKKCGTKCPLFHQCPMMPLSISRANAGSPCLLNKGGNAMIRRFINLVARGEAGILDEINNTLYHYSFDIETAAPGIKERYVLMLLQLHKQLHGDPKAKAQEEKPQLTVIINEMGSDGKKQIVVPIVEAGHIGNSVNNLIAAQAIAAEADELDDPESLAGSPMLQDLITGAVPHPVHHLSAEARNTEQGPGGRFRRKNVPEQDSKTTDDEPPRTESQPEELAETPGSAVGRS